MIEYKIIFYTLITIAYLNELTMNPLLNEFYIKGNKSTPLLSLICGLCIRFANDEF